MVKRLTYSPQTIVKLPNIFGDGAEGDVTLSGTVNLTGYHFYRNLTIAAGAIVTSQQSLFVSGRLLNLGTYRCNGQAASFSGGNPGNNNIGSTAFNSANGTGAVANGNPALSSNFEVPVYVSTDGKGGNAGAQTGGQATLLAGIGDWSANYIKTIIQALSGQVNLDGTLYPIPHGNGGGGGANATGAAVASGGGGGPGGVAGIFAYTLDNRRGIIEAKGAAGGAATGTGNGGGGGGGSGGGIVIVGITIVQGTLDVSGGAGGAGIGTGSAGNAGSAGWTKIIRGA